MRTIKGIEITNQDIERLINEGKKLKFMHFKGKEVVTESLAYDAETAEKRVIYHHVDSTKLWDRLLDEFLSEVDHEKYPEATQLYRFEFLGCIEENSISDEINKIPSIYQEDEYITQDNKDQTIEESKSDIQNIEDSENNSNKTVEEDTNNEE